MNPDPSPENDPVPPTQDGVVTRFATSARFVGKGVVDIVHYLYLSRVPLLGLVVLFVLPASVFTGLRALTLGAYDIQSIRQAVALALALYAVSGSVYITARIVWEQAGERFRIDVSDYEYSLKAGWMTLGILGSVVNGVVAIMASANHLRYQILAGFSLGIGIAVVVMRFAGWLERKLIQDKIKQARNRVILPLGFDQQPGYMAKPSSSGQKSGLARDHVAALAYGIILLVGYLIFIHLGIPALVALLVLTALIVFYLAGAAFFLDRFRVPLLVSVAAYCVAMVGWKANDHYYRIWPSPGELSKEARPAEVIRRAMKAGRPIVVVASAGGGIQAAAWTTTTLRRIGEELPQYDFPGSVRLISGVSGGSVGGLFYARAFDSTNDGRFEAVDRAVQESSLSKAMSGMLKADLRRALLPFTVYDFPVFGMSLYDDRADALELAWTTNADRALGIQSSLRSATLRSWGDDALKLTRPALIFNSTVVETGERMAFSTIPTTNSGPGKCEFQKRYAAEIAMTTAARLSATFPLISPTARPAPSIDPEAPGFAIPGPALRSVFPRGGNLLHLVDGGYYENSGIVGAVEWLDDAFQELSEAGHHPENLPREVLFIELNAFPMRPTTDETKLPGPQFVPPDAGLTSQGTLFDLASPLLTIMNVRNSGQKAFATQLLTMFKARWKLGVADPTHYPGVRVRHVPIYYDVTGTNAPEKTISKAWKIGVNPETQPLSWHLRECEKNDITNRLVHLRQTEAFATIENFFQTHTKANTIPHER